MSVCALVGAITVSRAVSDEQLSREVLKTVAQVVKNPGADHSALPLIEADSYSPGGCFVLRS
jgi:hypothetical protein